MLLRDKKIKKVSKLDTFFIFDGWRVGLLVLIGYAYVVSPQKYKRASLLRLFLGWRVGLEPTTFRTTI